MRGRLSPRATRFPRNGFTAHPNGQSEAACTEATELALLVAGSALIAAVSLALFELAGRTIARPARFVGASDRTLHRVKSTMRILGVVMAAWGVLAYTGLLSGLTVLTISGIVGLVVSLALQSTLTNMLAGFFLLGDHAVAPGDLITIGAVYGKVVRIALRNTWVETSQGDIAIVSNSVLAAGPLTNHSFKSRELRVKPVPAIFEKRKDAGARPEPEGAADDPRA